MGYNIGIGNAVVESSKEYFPELEVRWCVERIHLVTAPTFPNDELTGNGNYRSPSYTQWNYFCKKADIFDLFYDKDTGFLREHSGCFGLLPEHVDVVALALKRYRVKATLPPGFDEWEYEGPPQYDGILARLTWLEYWMRWAVETCETPAVYNS